MTKYKFGDVVFVTFYQTDGSKKRRPALVILDTGDDDIRLLRKPYHSYCRDS